MACSDPQRGRGPFDRKASIIKNHLRYLNSGLAMFARNNRFLTQKKPAKNPAGKKGQEIWDAPGTTYVPHQDYKLIKMQI